MTTKLTEVFVEVVLHLLAFQWQITGSATNKCLYAAIVMSYMYMYTSVPLCTVYSLTTSDVHFYATVVILLIGERILHISWINSR